MQSMKPGVLAENLTPSTNCLERSETALNIGLAFESQKYSPVQAACS